MRFIPESSPFRPWLNSLLNFGLGALIGGFLALAPLSYVWFFVSDVQTIHLLVIAGFGTVGGLLSMLGGDRVRQYLVGLLESMTWE